MEIPVESKEEVEEAALPGSNAEPIDITVDGVGAGEAHLVEIQVPGSGEDFVEVEHIQTSVRQVNTKEFATNAIVAQVLDELI